MRTTERGERRVIGNDIADRGRGVGNGLDRERVGIVDDDRGLFHPCSNYKQNARRSRRP